MNKFMNWNRYAFGAMIGMIGEYLFRVKFDIIPLSIIILLILVAVIDIINTDCHKNKKI